MASLLGSKVWDTPRELATASKIYSRLLATAGPALTQRLGDQSWVAVGSMANGWVNSGGSNANAAYRVRDGILQLRGTVKNGAASTTTPVFTLPAAYIPDTNSGFNIIFVNAAGGGGFARIDIDTAGGVYINSWGNGGSNTGVSFDGIQIPMGAPSPGNAAVDGPDPSFPWTASPIPNGMTANALAWYLKVFHPIDRTLTYLDNDDTGWQSLALLNSWAPYVAPWAPPQWRVRRGQMWFRGLMRSGTAPLVEFSTIPVGTRPSAVMAWHTLARGGGAVGSTTENGLAQIQVDAAGRMFLNRYIDGGTNVYVSLAGMSYVIDNRVL